MRRFLALLTLLALAGCGSEGSPGEPVDLTVGLDFTPNAVHAGLYAAVRTGADSDEGVRLKIRAPSGGSPPDSVKLLTTGRVDIAVVDIHDLGIARAKGADLVGVGALVQRPLAAVIARGDLPILVPSELEGKRVGVTGLPSDEAVLKAVVEFAGGDYDKVKRVTIGFSAVASLLAGKVDAVTGFWNAEGVVLKLRGLRILEFRVEQFGAPRYPELVLAVTRETLETRRDDIKHALAAIAKGTEAALADRPAATREIAAASEASEQLVGGQLESIVEAFDPPMRLNRTTVEGWADFAVEFGILDAAPDVDAAFDFELAD